MKYGKLETVWSSRPLESDWLTLEILFGPNPILSVNREKGMDFLEVEIFGMGYGDVLDSYTIVPFADLLNALLKVKELFEDIRRFKMQFGKLEMTYSSYQNKYDWLPIEVFSENKRIILINQDKGGDSLEVELLGTDDNLRVTVSFSDLLNALLDIDGAFEKRYIA